MGYRTVLAGTDGSSSSYLAVARAGEIAAAHGATLHLVSAYHPADSSTQEQAKAEMGDLSYKVRGSNPAEEALEEARRQACEAAGSDLPVEKHAVEGDPVGVLLATAGEVGAEVIVVGNRGLNRLANRLLGSVPQNVLHKAPCDVLVVHSTPEGKD